jgi:hypothetical protein
LIKHRQAAKLAIDLKIYAVPSHQNGNPLGAFEGSKRCSISLRACLNVVEGALVIFIGLAWED